MDEVRAWVSSLPFEWTQGCPEQVFYEAREAHRSPGRHYHTWDHVLDCVEKLRAIPVEAPRPVFLALVFHDAVYVAGRADNEALSAGLAADVLGEHAGLPQAELEAIDAIILATRHHVAPAGATRELRVALDIDMSILGSEPGRYDAYAEQVRREWVPAAATPQAFAAGRAAFLSKLLASAEIYATDEGKARWEASARENVARARARLRGSARPWARRLAWLARTSRRG